MPDEQPLIRIYGGSKLYDSGFCNGDIYDLYFIPKQNTENESKSDELSEHSSVDELSSINSQTFLTNHLHDSDDESNITEDGQRSTRRASINDRSGMNGPHRLHLKENSSVRLLAPKSGIEGKYFLLKTELSNSKSTFTTENTSHKENYPLQFYQAHYLLHHYHHYVQIHVEINKIILNILIYLL